MTTVAIDNDILHKGAGFGLLHELIGAIPAQMHEVGILGTAKFVVAKKLRKANHTEALILLDQVIQQTHPLEPTESEARFAAELEYAAQRANINVDSGESLLCAIAIERWFAWLVTGDKNAIKGMEVLVAKFDAMGELAGKVVCLEQLLMRLIKRGDAKAIRSAICAQSGLDRALALCFSCSCPEVGPENWAKGLESYVRDVRAAAPSIIAP